MSALEKLIAGYRDFYQKYFVENQEVYARLSHGQSPRIAMIACSDSRVDPSIITNAEPGDLFVVRNVANLIPPYQPDTAYHGTSAAIEFAVKGLAVEHVIVCGHRHCAGIRRLVEKPEASDGNGPGFVDSWMRIADNVREDVIATHRHLDTDALSHLCEFGAIEQSLRNLRSFPWIVEREKAGKLELHGWYLDIDEGMLHTYDHTTGHWEAMQKEDGKKE